MDKELDFYEVSADYISYLLRFDPKVPKVDYSATSKHDKFLCGIVLSVNSHDYFAPISSFTTPQRTNIIIKNEEGKNLSSIRFSFMIPVPQGVVSLKRIKDEPSLEYRRLLNWELSFCQKNSKAIQRLAKFVYNTAISKKDPVMVKNCCDFSRLETACAEYVPPLAGVVENKES
jgi:protein AbiQ